ncbi:NUDIX hydrolase domain-like protein [Elsinoe ampelina]|uniref:NUDIX hydrolase domain-like protein n=1 Tax=Elsinoe ampelina TaxID=302913 RepID=A0A6A6GMB3_9PEZI|nr:NUDIX hydrolase domain-like protein [Elsinoe ampelina]
MDSFNFARVKSYLPTAPDLSKLPALPKNMPSMPQLPFQLPTVGGLRTPPATTNDLSEDTSYSSPLPSAEAPTSSASNLNPLDPTPIDSSLPKTNLDLINECDNFPYLSTHPELYFRHTSTYYHLQIAAHPGICLGYILPRVAAVFEGLPDWSVDHDERTVVLLHGDTSEERSRIVHNTTTAMRETGHFEILKGWRNELYDVYGPTGEVVFTVERAASALLGVLTYGCHLTAYTRVKNEAGEEELKIWVPRRARSKQTYGGMLDNTVAGGLATGELPLECLLREAQEEASLPEEQLRERTRAVGIVSYFHIRDRRAGGERGLLQPECQFVYDADLTGTEITPKPEDGEVETFELIGVGEVREAMSKGEFKPNCALVLLDFFVRHGVLTPDNERDYVRIVTRLRRGIDFPTR